MKLYFSQARKRQEQASVKFCEALNIGGMGMSLMLLVGLLIHNLLK